MTNPTDNNLTDAQLIANSLSAVQEKYTKALNDINTLAVDIPDEAADLSYLNAMDAEFARIQRQGSHFYLPTPLPIYTDYDKTGAEGAPGSTYYPGLVSWIFEGQTVFVGRNYTNDPNQYSEDLTSAINSVPAENLLYQLMENGGYSSSVNFNDKNASQESIVVINQIISSMVNDFVNYMSDIQNVPAAQADLISLDPSFASLLSSATALLSGLSHLQNATAEDKSDIASAIASLFQVLQLKVQVDELQAKINAAKTDPTITDTQLEEWSLQATNLQSQEQTLLQSLMTMLETDNNNFQSEIGKADVSLAKNPSGLHDFIDFFHNCSGAQIRKQDHEIIDNANAMISLFTTFQKAISPEIASTMNSGMLGIGAMIDSLIQQVNGILNDKSLTGSQKKAKILFIMMLMLGLLTQLKAQIAKNQSALQNVIATAAQKASLQNNQDALQQQEQIAALQKTAKQLQGFLKVVQIVMTVAMFMVLGPLSLVMVAGMGIMTGLQYSGETEKWTNELAAALYKGGKKDGVPISHNTSQLLAQGIITYYEAGLFSGGAAGPSGVAEEAVKTAEVVAAKAVEEMVTQVIVMTEKAADNITEETLQGIQKNAIEESLAAVKAISMKLERLAQTKSSLGTIKNLLMRAAKKETTDAKIAKEAFKQLEIQIRDQIAKMVETGSTQFTRTTNEIANQTIADAINTVTKSSKMTEKLIGQLTDDITKQMAKSFAKKAVGFSLYFTATNNVIMSILQSDMNKKGVDRDSKEYQNLQIIMSVIQGLMLAIGGMVAFTPSVMAEMMPAMLMRMLGVIQMGSQATSAGLDGALANNDLQQARILPEVAKDQAAITGFNLLLTKLFELNQSNMDAYTKKETALVQANNETAGKVVSMQTEKDLMSVLGIRIIRG